MSRRLNALVIGNAAYEAVDALKNPVNDAGDVGAKLESCGFTVIRCLDSDHAGMDRTLKKFQRVLKDSDVGLFFFAGHGMQIDGENYLAAVDTDATDEITAKHSSLPLNRVIEVMEKSGCSTSIVVLDACRNNPFERAWTRAIESRGLAPVYAPRGTLIAYATSPGQTASDGRGRNGAYTAALLTHLATPDCSIETMFQARAQHAQRRHQRQTDLVGTHVAGRRVLLQPQPRAAHRPVCRDLTKRRPVRAGRGQGLAPPDPRTQKPDLAAPEPRGRRVHRRGGEQGFPRRAVRGRAQPLPSSLRRFALGAGLPARLRKPQQRNQGAQAQGLA